MEHSKLITEKIEQLTELAKIEGEPNVQIIMLALSGARTMGHDGQLAGAVQDFLREVLKPKLQSEAELSIASKN